MDFIISNFIMFVIFTVISIVFLRFAVSRSLSFTKYLITCLSVLVYIDTSLYMANVWSYLMVFSNTVQSLLKSVVGMVFIYRNKYWDYAFALFIIFCIYIAAFIIENHFYSGRKNHGYFIENLNIRKPKNKANRILLIVQIVCPAITTLITVLTFIVNLNKK